MDKWVGLIIGNSRLHFCGVTHNTIVASWHQPHSQTTPPVVIPTEWRACPLWFASVVPDQTLLWCTYPHARQVNLVDIPLRDKYDTMGCDRALAAYGAAERYGVPVLVVDSGTALTLTGVNQDLALVGGAILPGIGLQFHSLATQTGALPQVNCPPELPPRWSHTTVEAIASGTLYTLLAGLRDFIQDWRSHYPHSPVVLTGGDGEWLRHHLTPSLTDLYSEPTLVLSGLVTLIESQSKMV
ncbi:pantothenate kinase [Spirulina sp.]|uniref:pantothenate kinase n=1 Tax=Spirulina sp. TaxID=1157 RepID=UPI003F6F971D